MPSTSILSFWQLFLNTSSPNNYMSVSKRNTSIMRNSCSSLSTTFPLHKRTWVFVWWRYKSCCWVVKQKIDVMSNSRIWQNRPTIYLLINVIQIKSFHESTLLSLKKVFSYTKIKIQMLVKLNKILQIWCLGTHVRRIFSTEIPRNNFQFEQFFSNELSVQLSNSACCFPGLCLDLKPIVLYSR